MPGFLRLSKTIRVLGKGVFRSLRHRNFRLFYAGQLVSMIGSWMQFVVQAWLVYRLTQSSLILGLVSATALAPILMFGLHGGLIADRLSRYRLFIITQILAMMQALTLSVLTLTGLVQPWHILLLAFLLGMVHALEMPARHSFIAQLVSREDLPNAIALNASLIHLARFIGPAIAGWLVAWVGEGLVFLINGVTFLAVIIALLAMRFPGRIHLVSQKWRCRELWEGIHFAWRDTTTRYALSMVGLVSLVGTSAAILMPVFVTHVFHSGAQSLGLLLGLMAAGSLVGAITLAKRRKAIGLVRVIGRGGMGGGIALSLFAVTQELWIALLILPAIGFSLTMVIAASNTIIQIAVPDHLRGRVMSLYTMTFHGLMPLGILMVGGSAEYIGAPFTVAACGILQLVAASLFTLLASRKQQRTS